MSADGLSGPNNVTRGQIQRELPDNHDLAKAVDVASQAAGNNWLNWLEERQNNALDIVENNWALIEPLGEGLIRKLGRNAVRQIIFGSDLIALFRKAKVPTQHMPMVEIVYTDDLQPFLVRCRRFFRSLGKKGVVTHYINR